MFAVPGWALAASSPVQEQVRSKKSVSRQASDLTAKASKKRKRHTEISANEVRDNGEADEPGHTNLKISNQKRGDAEAAIPISKRKEVTTIPSQQNGDHVNTGPLSSTSLPHHLSHEKGQPSDDRIHEHRKKQKKSGSNGISKPSSKSTTPKVAVSLPQTPSMKLTPLQAKMRSKLTSARFRHLNETLYTTNSTDALNLFTTSPELFADYHAGFAQQVKDSWPQNPVDGYVRALKERGSSKQRSEVVSLPRRKTGICTIADLGCGDAPLARGCQSVVGSLKIRFHNYDLHTPNSLVTKADISNLPLRDGEIDIAVFCLSLMGTNWIDFVEEAWRILRGDGKGEVWVAEVKSRFGRVTRGRVVENSVGKRRKKPNPKGNDDDEEQAFEGLEKFVEDEQASRGEDDETDISAFVKVFTRRGFQLQEGSVNKRNKMFVNMVFKKTGIPTAGKYKGLKWTGKEYQKQQDGKMRFAGGQREEDEVTLAQESKVLKPCVYKTR